MYVKWVFLINSSKCKPQSFLTADDYISADTLAESSNVATKMSAALSTYLCFFLTFIVNFFLLLIFLTSFSFRFSLFGKWKASFVIKDIKNSINLLFISVWAEVACFKFRKQLFYLFFPLLNQRNLDLASF